MATAKFSSSNDDHVVKVFLDDNFNDKRDEKALENETKAKMEMKKGDVANGGLRDEEGEEERRAMLQKEKGESGCDKEGERQSWSKKREYLLTLMGYIVGVGNLWRFPYMCNRNGGGAFLLPFVLCVIFMGFPLFFLETALGQFTGRSPLHVWSVCPLFKGTSMAMCIGSLISFWYFNTIMSWALYYTVVYVTATAPFLMLTVLLVRGVTLPGAMDGILFYITPDFERLLDLSVWVEAGLQVFYSLGPGWGGLVAMASYNKFDNDCLKDALLLSFLGEGTSVFGGFAIFSVLGYMAHQTGVPVGEVVSSGPGLVFIVYPEAISMLPLPQLWAVLFFIMLVTIVIDTQLGSGETVLTIVSDSFPRTLGRHRVLVTGGFCLICLVSSLILVSQGGVYAFQLFDWFIATITNPSVVFVECVVISWVYGADRFGEDIQMMLGRKPPMIINILWCFVNPLLLAVLLLVTLVKYQPPTYGDYHYDIFGTIFGWFIAFVSFVPIPGMAIYLLLKAKGSLLKRLKQTTTPNEHWGPADPTSRLLYQEKMRQRAPRRRFLDVLR